MSTNRTELMFILDRSGSMSGLEADTIGGFNALLQKQREEPGTAIVTTALFDHKLELLHDRLDIRGIAPLNSNDYFVRGSTALLDAIGQTANKVISAQAHTLPEYRPEKTVVVITTDGLENASHEYTHEQVRELVNRQQAQGWEFLFLGANIDAIAAARHIGIDASHTVNYRPDSAGTRTNFRAVSEAVCCMRAAMPLTADWKRDIEEEFERDR